MGGFTDSRNLALLNKMGVKVSTDNIKPSTYECEAIEIFTPHNFNDNQIFDADYCTFLICNISVDLVLKAKMSRETSKNKVNENKRSYIPDSQLYRQKFEEIKLKNKIPKKFSTYIKAQLESNTTPRKRKNLKFENKDYGEFKNKSAIRAHVNLRSQKTVPLMDGEHKKSFSRDINNSLIYSEKNYNFKKDQQSPDVNK